MEPVEEPSEQELMKNLADGEDIPDGVVPVDYVPQEPHDDRS